MIILDTNVVSDPLRRSPTAKVIAWLDRQHTSTLAITAFTAAELRFGAAILPLGQRRDRLQQRIEAEVLPVFGDRIFPFDPQASASWAALRAHARAEGRSLPLMDSLIAAICLSRNCILATRNEADFQGLGLEIINPWNS